MQAEAWLGCAFILGILAALVASTPAAAQGVALQTSSVPTGLVPIPVPSAPSGEPTGSSTTSESVSNIADPWTWTTTHSQGLTTKCRGCLAPDARLTSDRSETERAGAAENRSNETASPAALSGSEPPSGGGLDSAFALPGFGVLVGVAATYFAMRRRHA